MEPKMTDRTQPMYGYTDGQMDEATHQTNQTQARIQARCLRMEGWSGMERREEEREGGREGKREGRILRREREREKACVSNNSFPSARRPLILGQKQDKRPPSETDKGQRSGKTEK